MARIGVDTYGSEIYLRIVITDIGGPLQEGEKFDFTSEVDTFNDAWLRLFRREE